jgi:transcription elongation factor GreB
VSRAFTKEDEAGEAPLVPRRAPLPQGVPNYVTSRGLAALRAELAELHALVAAARTAPGAGSEPEAARARALNALAERVAELETRLGSAELVTAPELAPDEIRFGATVTVASPSGAERSYTIVGVDEADATAGRIAFVAPLARALLGKHAGDVAVVRTPHGDEELAIIALNYERD